MALAIQAQAVQQPDQDFDFEHLQARQAVPFKEEPPAEQQQEDNPYIPIAQKLMSIVLTHQKMRDPLSNKLFMQGSEFALYMLNEGSADLPVETLLSHYFSLKTIIQEQCCCERVTNIWLDHEKIKVWEKKELDLYCKAFSHHAGRVVTCIELAAPHVLGNEILNWIQDVERPFAHLVPPPPSRELALPPTVIARNDLGVPVIQGLKKKRENLINTLVVNPDAPIDAHTADQVLEVFEQRMEDFSLAKKNKEAELQKIRATEDLMRQNGLLKNTLEQKNQQRDKDIIRVAESGREQVNYLIDSLNKTASNFDSAMTEKIKIDKLREERLEKCEKAQAASTIKIAQQDARITSLESRVFWSEQRINGLENEVRNMDSGSGCVIS